MSIVNQANTNNFKIVFSNIPVPSTRTSKLDMQVMNNYVRSVTLPDFSIELLESPFMNTVQRVPVSRYNSDLSPLTIEFKADEDLENYLAFFDWISELRCNNSTSESNPTYRQTIDIITVIMRDNENRNNAQLRFKDNLIINLSSLNLQFGVSEPMIFSVTLQFNTWEIVRTDATLNN